MIKWLKSLFSPTAEDRKLSEQIKRLYETHDVRVGRRYISVTRKKK